MNEIAQLRETIAAVLAFKVKQYEIVRKCVTLGITKELSDQPAPSKEKYVLGKIEHWNEASLLDLAQKVLKEYGKDTPRTFTLLEVMRAVRAGGKRKISEITRKNLIDEISSRENWSGKRNALEFVRKIWPIDHMGGLSWQATLAEEISQHMIRNDDWPFDYLCERLGVTELSDEGFLELMELLVDPNTRHDETQATLVEAINKHLIRDGFILRESDRVSGYPAFKAAPIDSTVGEPPKNLIFASTGPKPEIVLLDAIHNQLKVVKNAEFCLFYDDPIPSEGLRWRDLVHWWASRENLDPVSLETEHSLYKRLEASMPSSPPERKLFFAYYKRFKKLGERLPALIPQVYVHYDPRTAAELYGKKRLPRQRMDFLLLLAHGNRVVIEVDGERHYSTDGQPDPGEYATMVQADRQLRLCGYHVFRFGGAELQLNNAENTVAEFFDGLFKKYEPL